MRRGAECGCDFRVSQGGGPDYTITQLGIVRICPLPRYEPLLTCLAWTLLLSCDGSVDY